MEQITLQGKYNFEPLTIQATRQTPNTVSVIILVGDPEQAYKKNEHFNAEQKRLFAGTSFCHPKDEFDMLEGVKHACRHALEIKQIGGWDWTPPSHERLRAIYRACRVAINAEWEKEAEQRLVKGGIAEMAAIVSGINALLKEHRENK